jgi:hypothetical protein
MMYDVCMHRTQILLDPWQYERLKAAAEREGRSISSLVRDAVSRFLEVPPAETSTKLAEISGLGADPGSRGRDHDAVIYGPGREDR